MAQVIKEQGLESIEKRIGVDATGARFNSIIAVRASAQRSAPAHPK
jgi:glutaminase